MGTRHHYTVDQARDLALKVTSYRQLLLALNITAEGGNYASIKRFCTKHQIDVSHFTSKAWSRGKTLSPKRPLSDYLSNKYYITSDALRRRLIREGYFEARCQLCKLDSWLGKPIPLELHHIDCDHDNNNLINLQILCPNCHSFMPTKIKMVERI